MTNEQREQQTASSKPPRGKLTALADSVFMRAIGVTGVGFCIIVAAISGASLVAAAMRTIAPSMPPAELSAIALIAMQAATVLATLFVAGSWGPLRQTLATVPPRATLNVWSGLVAIVAAMIAISLLLATVVFPRDFARDAATFVPMLRSDAATFAIIAVVIGAPFAEELLFRGLLFGALLRSGVSLIATLLLTNAMWTALHAGYSFVGLTEVFMAGLILSVARVVTGSVWPAISIHMFYNAIALSLILSKGWV